MSGFTCKKQKVRRKKQHLGYFSGVTGVSVIMVSRLVMTHDHKS